MRFDYQQSTTNKTSTTNQLRTSSSCQGKSQRLRANAAVLSRTTLESHYPATTNTLVTKPKEWTNGVTSNYLITNLFFLKTTRVAGLTATLTEPLQKSQNTPALDKGRGQRTPQRTHVKRRRRHRDVTTIKFCSRPKKLCFCSRIIIVFFSSFFH